MAIPRSFRLAGNSVNTYVRQMGGQRTRSNRRSHVLLPLRSRCQPSSEAEIDEVMVPLSALGMAKAALYEAMREQGVGREELARRLRWHLPQINRVLDLRHASRMEHVEAALAALGLRLIVDVARAA